MRRDLVQRNQAEERLRAIHERMTGVAEAEVWAALHDEAAYEGVEPPASPAPAGQWSPTRGDSG